LTVLTAPRPVAKLPSTPIAPQENVLKSASRLFGVSEARAQVEETFQLVGVFANSKGGGFATFNTRNGPISIFAGNEIVPGVRLKQIERDRVIVLSSGIQRELRLPEHGGQTSGQNGQAAMVSLPQTATSVPPGEPAINTRQQESPNLDIARPQEEEK
jgi:hypothetical protein